MGKIFKPQYGFKKWILLVISLVMSILLLFVLFKFNFLFTEQLLFWAIEILMIVSFVFFLIAFSYKKIIFADNIVIKKMFFKDIVLDYEDITHISLKKIKTEKGNVLLALMENKDELFDILIEKIEQGLIDFTEENKESMKKEIKDVQSGLISFPISIIIYLIICLFPLKFLHNKLLNSLLFLAIMITVDQVLKRFFLDFY